MRLRARANQINQFLFPSALNHENQANLWSCRTQILLLLSSSSSMLLLFFFGGEVVLLVWHGSIWFPELLLCLFFFFFFVFFSSSSSSFSSSLGGFPSPFITFITASSTRLFTRPLCRSLAPLSRSFARSLTRSWDFRKVRSSMSQLQAVLNHGATTTRQFGLCVPN